MSTLGRHLRHEQNKEDIPQNVFVATLSLDKADITDAVSYVVPVNCMPVAATMSFGDNGGVGGATTIQLSVGGVDVTGGTLTLAHDAGTNYVSDDILSTTWVHTPMEAGDVISVVVIADADTPATDMNVNIMFITI